MRLFEKIRKWFGNQEHLFYLFLVVLTVPNVALCFTEPMSWMAKVCNVLLPFSVYYVVMSRVRNCGWGFWMLFPVVFLGAFQLVLLYLFGRSIIAVDMFLNLVTTNSSEAFELLDNLVPALVFVTVLYVPALVFATFSIAYKRRLGVKFVHAARRRAWIALAVGVCSLLAAYGGDRRYELKADLYPANVCYNIYLAFQRTACTRNYPLTSASFTYRAESSRQADGKEVYVMVIGETSRACNWSLYGYPRQTTPGLSRCEGLVAFPYVLSESNTTHKSVPMLLSPVSAGDYDSLYYRKSIVTAFKEAGFHTAFFSNQRYNHSFIDFFGMEADVCRFIKEESPVSGGNPSDAELLKLVADVLKDGNEKQFIVLHLYGSHFNYRERYPLGQAVYLPDTPADAEAKYKNSLVNAYDNTIWFTDRFLSELAGMLKMHGGDAAMLYTSDHGEDIFDDGRLLFLHASPVPSYYQIHVPFLVWLSEDYRRNHPAIWQAVQDNRLKNVSSSASFFHTMLGVGGIGTSYRNDSLSVAGNLFRERRRVYLNDHNEARTLDDVGMQEEDFEMLQRHGIGCWP